ncbi:MAG: hypothetical protein LUO89_10190, partial [Methanothrix sp.]|nr:hypothetical protein [Methanothrix sp.]
KEVPANDKGSIILAGTNADVSALNRMAQEAKRLAGNLGAESVRVGREEFFPGDRVLFTKNSMALSVMNGDCQRRNESPRKPPA